MRRFGRCQRFHFERKEKIDTEITEGTESTEKRGDWRRKERPTPSAKPGHLGRKPERGG